MKRNWRALGATKGSKRCDGNRLRVFIGFLDLIIAVLVVHWAGLAWTGSYVRRVYIGRSFGMDGVHSWSKARILHGGLSL